MKPGERLRIVLDTNVILNALSPRLPYRSILQNLFFGKYDLCVTTEILLEYEEKISEFYSPAAAVVLLDALTISSHVQKTEVFFRFNVIADLDDNKFVDCAIASRSDYLVTNDKDYRPLKKLQFPKLTVLTMEEFIEVLKA